MSSFANKTFLVTGGNSGMGYDVARHLSAHGAKVYITGRNPEAISKAAKDLGKNVIGVVADAGSVADATKLANTVSAHGDQLDGLFINAGVAKFVPFDAVDEALFDELVNTNVKGPYFTIQKLLPVLRDGSSIVLNSSDAMYGGFAASSAYTLTKAGLTSLAKTLSRDLLARKIRVNSVNPGLIRTPIMAKTGVPADMLDGFLDGLAQQVPLGRMGKVEEVTGYVAFLLSDASTFMLGTDIAIDGGLTTL